MVIVLTSYGARGGTLSCGTRPWPTLQLPWTFVTCDHRFPHRGIFFAFPSTDKRDSESTFVRVANRLQLFHSQCFGGHHFLDDASRLILRYLISPRVCQEVVTVIGASCFCYGATFLEINSLSRIIPILFFYFFQPSKLSLNVPPGNTSRRGQPRTVLQHTLWTLLLTLVPLCECRIILHLHPMQQYVFHNSTL